MILEPTMITLQIQNGQKSCNKKPQPMQLSEFDLSIKKQSPDIDLFWEILFWNFGFAQLRELPLNGSNTLKCTILDEKCDQLVNSSCRINCISSPNGILYIE